jgi:penicillin G amidase
LELTVTMSRRSRLWVRILGALLLLAAALAAAAWMAARASLPVLDGTRTLAGLGGSVVVERDALGVPTVHGASRADVARATGFLHAQERFFQMDLARRFAAGELAELVGDAALPVDRVMRLHAFRPAARKAVAETPEAARRIIEAYAAGVNAGLDALGARPPEYLLLRSHPAAWHAEDSILLVAYMYFGLQAGSMAREGAFGIMRETLPPALVAFLQPGPDQWEAPIVGDVPAEPRLPTPDEVNLRAALGTQHSELGTPFPALGTRDSALGTSFDLPGRPGSNSWAVDARHAAGGRALLANDMHLELGVPNIWYRMVLTWPDPAAPGGQRRLVGVSLPGTPAVVVGSNGQVAWGFTNAGIDATDFVVLEPDPSSPGAYRTPAGPAVPTVRRESIARKGGAAPEALRVEETPWGPIVDTDRQGRRRVLAWVVHQPGALNLRLMDMESAATVAQALDVGASAGIPAQNLVAADSAGHIGWTIAGAIPNRVGYDGMAPVSWADGTCRWDGVLPPAAHPRVVDPDSGRIWTANNQVVFGSSPAVYSPLSVDEGARARQIRDDLLALGSPVERDLLRIQLDDRALFLDRWRTVLLQALDTPGALTTTGRREFHRLVASSWDGRASADSVGYTLVNRWHRALTRQVFEALTGPCRAAVSTFDWIRPVGGPAFTPPWPARTDGPLWRMVTGRPLNLLAPRFKDWDEQLLAAVDAVVEQAAAAGTPMADLRWGTIDSGIRHPLSGALGPLGRYLDMDPIPLGGGYNVPRQRMGNLMASERLVVSPGREETAVFHMPGGQSGHPLSPHYRDGHLAWVRGDPTPLLPGGAVHRLVLSPQ